MADGTELATTHGRYAAATFELFTESADDLAELLSHSKADRTLEGYASDFRQFTAWATSRGIEVPWVYTHVKSEDLPAPSSGHFVDTQAI